MSRQNSSKEKMFSLIRKWQASDQSQKAFCKRQGIAYATFHYYYKFFKKEKSVSFPSSKFIPLQVTQAEAGFFASIDFAGGGNIKLYQVVNPDYLKELLS